VTQTIVTDKAQRRADGGSWHTAQLGANDYTELRYLQREL